MWSILGLVPLLLAAVPGPQAPAQAPVQRPPSLMDHTVALRQEVAALRQELNAVAQVTDAVGQAVGQLYNSFFQQPEATTYSSAFQAQGSEEQGRTSNEDALWRQAILRSAYVRNARHDF